MLLVHVLGAYTPASLENELQGTVFGLGVGGGGLTAVSCRETVVQYITVVEDRGD